MSKYNIYDPQKIDAQTCMVWMDNYRAGLSHQQQLRMFNQAKSTDKGFTHGGKFHSDDVFATAFLRILNPKITIERGFDVPENFDGIVYDIGRGEFDHHQQDKEYRENGCPYAAFGLIWRAFGADFIGEEEAVHFDEKFIQPLDESDNTGCDNMLAKVIGEFNPGWDSTESYDDCFWKAEAMAEVILRNHFESVEGAKRGSALVKEAMERSDGKILILPRFAPWKKEVTGSSYLFTIYPSNRGGYSVQAVPAMKILLWFVRSRMHGAVRQKKN